MSREQRLALVEREHRELPLSVQAEVLGLNRSSLYYHPVAITAEEIALKHRIDAIYTATPFYGVRRVTAQLHREGWPVNHKAVARHMQEMGIAGICPGPNLSRRAHQATIYPYLLRGVTASYPNHVWGLDITYIRLEYGWMYLVVVLDWYSRFIISWELNQSLHLPFVLDALDGALDQAHPLICNSDQGSHFTSQEYLERLQAANIQISMDGKGRALDNIFTERLWRTIKYEEVYLREYATPREARHGLSRYIQFYNQERPHQALQYRTPAEVYYMKEGSSTLAVPISMS